MPTTRSASALARRAAGPPPASQLRPDEQGLAPPLLALPSELLVHLLHLLDTRDLGRVDQLSHAFHSAPASTAAVRLHSLVEQVLRKRAADGGHAVPAELGGEATWAQLLMWRERRRRWGKAKVVAGGDEHSVFLAPSQLYSIA